MNYSKPVLYRKINLKLMKMLYFPWKPPLSRLSCSRFWFAPGLVIPKDIIKITQMASLRGTKTFKYKFQTV